jgi:undecaprenyl-diphosphatase
LSVDLSNVPSIPDIIILMNEIIILTAKYLFLANLVIWVVVCLRLVKGGRLRFTGLTLAAAALAYGLAKIASLLISSPRPFVSEHLTPLIAHANDNGFPSDHTLIAALLALVVFTKHQVIGGVMLLIALAVGVSRVAANVHHPIDIAGSFVISAAAVAVIWQAERMLKKRSQAPAA